MVYVKIYAFSDGHCRVSFRDQARSEIYDLNKMSGETVPFF